MGESRAIAITDPEQLLTDVNAALQAETRIDIDELSLQLSLDDGVLVLDGRVDNIKVKRMGMSTIVFLFATGFALMLFVPAAATLETAENESR